MIVTIVQIKSISVPIMKIIRPIKKAIQHSKHPPTPATRFPRTDKAKKPDKQTLIEAWSISMPPKTSSTLFTS